MKRIKKVIAVVLSVVMMLSVSLVERTAGKEVKADAVFQITSPVNESLRAAGYIDIQWSDASSKGTVKDYQLYVDGKLIATTKQLTYEFYTTKVDEHTAYVVADFVDETTISTPSIKFAVTKKGLGLATDMGAKIDLADMGCAWYYNWGTSPSRGNQYKGIEYVPMIWGGSNANNISNQINGFVKAGYKYVLAFNEPEPFIKQSNMSVDQVYNQWSGFMNDNIRVSSPATALWPQASTDWFQPFMNKINANTDYDVDFIAIHCYPDNYGGAGMAQWFLKEVVDWTWKKYHKPIWITEFSTKGNVTEKATAEFWKAVMPELDEREYVERYAAFGFNYPKNQYGLWNYYTGKLSEGGQIYKDYGNPGVDYKKRDQDTGNNIVNNQNVTQNNNETAAPAAKKPTKAKIKSVKNLKGRKIKVSLKKIKKAAGYQIKWSDSRKFKGYWKKNTKKTTYTLKKLDRNTRYYIKARAYVKNGSKKLYGAWSKVKKIKVKK